MIPGDERLTEIEVRLAADQRDYDAARNLCREWLDWHWKHYPADWSRGADHPMDPTSFMAVVRDLPELHRRPDGGILVAWLNGAPVGCVMYRMASPNVAEFNRMFVSETGRGKGIGVALLNHLFKQLVADGYESVFFSSATFLTHARAMYENAGFVPMSHPQGFPEQWRDKVYFMERSLA